MRTPSFPDQPTLQSLDARLTAAVDLIADVVQRGDSHERDLNTYASAIQGLEQTVGDVVSKAPAEWERLATRIEEVARQTALNAEMLRAIMQKLGMER